MLLVSFFQSEISFTKLRLPGSVLIGLLRLSSLVLRTILTLFAGENAGGYKRGCMSAAIEYFKPNRRIMTLRIDYSNNPLKDLSMALEKRYSKECKDAFDR